MKLARCLALLALYATTTGAQTRMRPTSAAPSSRAVSTLSTADSTALVAAGARRVLDPADASDRCVRMVRDSVHGDVGSSFLKAARKLAAEREPATDNASDDDITLLGLRDGDTATVIVRHTGTSRVPRAIFWLNVIDYYFVRDTVPGGWRFVDRRLAEAQDFVVTSSETTRVPCRYPGARR